MANEKKTVVIAGSSGVIGQSAVKSFLDAGFRVLALSRRAPDVEPDKNLSHLAADLSDEKSVRAALANAGTVTHLAYTAVKERPGLLAGWTDKTIMDDNAAMFANLLTPIADKGALQHVSLLQGGKAYGVQFQPVPIPAREAWPRHDHYNFYWLQEDILRASAARHKYKFTIWRPAAVIGGAVGSVMNPLLPIAAYGALCRELNEPFGYPGGNANPFEIVDARLVADAMVWATDAPGADGGTFNITNGEVAEWQALWPSIAEALHLSRAPNRPMSMAKYLLDHADTWAKMAARHNLAERDMAKLMGESHHYADILFTGGGEHFPLFMVSTVKLRQAGFGACLEAPETFRYWLHDLVRRRIIPPLSK